MPCRKWKYILPELVLERIESESRSSAKYYLIKESDFEVCPKCATPSSSVYDRRNLHHAKIVADRFHVHRMLTRLTNKFRKKATGDKRKNPIRKLVLRNWDRLERHEQRALRVFLNSYPDLREVYVSGTK